MATAVSITGKKTRPTVVPRKEGLVINKDHYILMLEENKTLRRQVSILNQELALLRASYNRDVNGKMNTTDDLLEELAS